MKYVKPTRFQFTDIAENQICLIQVVRSQIIQTNSHHQRPLGALVFSDLPSFSWRLCSIETGFAQTKTIGHTRSNRVCRKRKLAEPPHVPQWPIFFWGNFIHLKRKTLCLTLFHVTFEQINMYIYMCVCVCMLTCLKLLYHITGLHFQI